MSQLLLAVAAAVSASPHCAGMCGPLVSACALRHGERVVLFPLLYNLGRITTYALLGMAAGGLGRAVGLFANRPVLLSMQAFADLLIISIGLAVAFRRTRSSATAASAGGFLRKGCSGERPFLLGLLFGFIPCGLVYGFLLGAAASRDPLAGAAILAALGVGTSPVLFAMSSASALFVRKGGALFIRCAGGSVALLGAINLSELLRWM